MTTSRLTVAIVVSMGMLSALPSTMRGQPPAGAGGGRGGGFTHPEPIVFDDREGWQSIFDGTLKNWDGDTSVWRAENRELIAEGSPEKPLPNPQTHLIWRGGRVKDFELKLEARLDGPGTNSGIQYRSFEPAPGRGLPPPGQAAPSGGRQGQPPRQQSRWLLGGYQYDLDFVGRFTGQLYEGFTGRGIVAWRGDVVHTMDGRKPQLVSSLGDPDALKGYMRIGDWNQVHLIARGNTLIHILNGHVMAILIDDDTKTRAFEGLLGVQLEGRPDASKVVFRNIYIKPL
jgi:3-keto-disaccharide hydrolase